MAEISPQKFKYFLKIFIRKKKVMTFCETQSWQNIAPKVKVTSKRNLGYMKVCVQRKFFLVNFCHRAEISAPTDPPPFLTIFEKPRIFTKITIFLALV
jgi:hypothetical protein